MTGRPGNMPRICRDCGEAFISYPYGRGMAHYCKPCMRKRTGNGGRPVKK